jgi:hypothetical protein
MSLASDRVAQRYVRVVITLTVTRRAAGALDRMYVRMRSWQSSSGIGRRGCLLLLCG